MKDFSDLKKRLKAASAPDRGLDYDLVRMINSVWVDALPSDFSPTTRIEDALALVREFLPDANSHGYDQMPNGVVAYVSRNSVASGHWFYDAGHNWSAPIAFILALIAALERQPNRRYEGASAVAD